MAAAVTFALSERDHVDAARGQYRHRLTRPRRMAATFAFLAALWGLFAYLDSDGPDAFFYVGLVYAALMVTVVVLAGAAGIWLAGRQARRLYRQQVIHPQSRIAWTDEGLRSDNEYGSYAAKWTDFYGWRHSRGTFTLFINEGFFYLIPEHALSPEQAIDLKETLLRSGLSQR
jgi:hypothetical protein